MSSSYHHRHPSQGLMPQAPTDQRIPSHHFQPHQQVQAPYQPHPYIYPQLAPQQQQHQQNGPGRNVVETKYLVTRNGPLGTQSQVNAATSFFARSHQRHPTSSATGLMASSQSPLASRRRRTSGNDSSEERDQFPTNFRTLVQRFPPTLPSGLLRKLEVVDPPPGLGKVRVILRVTKPSSASYVYDPMDSESGKNPHRHFEIDQKRRQVTLFDPSIFRGQNGNTEMGIEERKIGVAAPKMFAYDGLFTSDDTQEDLCSAALPDVIHSVINGNDGCLFCFGHANLGKTRTMLGSDQCAKDMGVIPITLSWLYKAIKERKTKMGSRFSVRVSALEITGQRECVRDLLAAYDTDHDESPAVYLRQLPVMGSCMQRQSELRASTAEKAAYYLDAALAGRSLDAQGRESHLVFTVHVYQYLVSGQGAMMGGRSRLHLIDFGGCERTKTPGGGITLSGLGNVILGIFNGQKHLPHRDSKVTQVLRECLGSLTCQATMLAHVSPEPSHYSETLHTIQLASRLHRMRRKRMKAHASGSASSDEHRRLSKLRSHRSGSSGRSSSDLTSGTSTNASSSEMSCDTVVYRGHSDGSGTDSEHPPIFMGTRMTSGGSSGGSSAPGSLRGSLDEIPRPISGASRRKKILTNGAISPRRNLSPQPQVVRSPHRSLSSLPVIHEVNINSGKMPLNGLVPVQGRQHRHLSNRAPQISEQWIDINPNYKSQSQSVFSSRKEVWMEPHHQPSRSSPTVSSSSVALSSQVPQPYPLARSPAVLSNPPKRYGYMDEHKANMITSWVENQSQAISAEELSNGDVPDNRSRGRLLDGNRNVNANNSQNVFHALTQFKTCDSDEGAEHKVIIHHHPTTAPPPAHSIGQGDEKEVDESPITTHKLSDPQLPPPPPLRRTPPRTAANFNDLVNECNKLAEHFKVDSMNQNEVMSPPFNTPSSRVDLEHPLRILSEENLTIVSSFAGSKDDLRSDGENDPNEDCDPSKLSFFQVPDFNSIKEDMEKQDDFISRRFREFAQLEEECHQSRKANRPTSDERPNRHSQAPNDIQLHLVPARNVNNNNGSPENEQHLPRVPVQSEGNQFPGGPSQATQISHNLRLSPQKQFELLGQSLRHPDGSSNPELHIIENAMISAVGKRRSPGNGRSSSDMEDENLNHQPTTASSRALCATDTANGNDFLPTQTSTLFQGKTTSDIAIAASKVVNNNEADGSKQHHQAEPNPSSHTGTATSTPANPKKERFGFRFLRIFGSSRKLNNNHNQKTRQRQNAHGAEERRSKSCDRTASHQVKPTSGGESAFNNNGKFPRREGGFFRASMRAASSSPSIKLGSGGEGLARRKGGSSIMGMNGQDGESHKQLMMLGRGDKENSQERDEKTNVMDISATPSSLSISTEWEFEGKKEDDHDEVEEQTQRGNAVMLQHLQNVYGKHLLPPSIMKNDRKSSGYDSLGGDESSSLDSNHEPEARHAKSAQNPPEVPYASPNDVYNNTNNIQIVQYDELDILRMDHRNHYE